MSDYDSYTVNSRNILARFAHRKRTSLAIRFAEKIQPSRILDFGCGDGNYLLSLNNTMAKKDRVFVGYEPYMDSKELNGKVDIFHDWAAIGRIAESGELFDLVTCFEVLEHFSEEQQERHLKKIKSVLTKNGFVLISVPIETGFVALIKNLRRVITVYKGNEHIYSSKNILLSIIGKKSREIHNLRSKEDYLPHMGFNYVELRRLIDSMFHIEKVLYSPLPFLGPHLNSQVFFLFRNK